MVGFAAAHGKPMALSEWGAPGNRSDLNVARYIENVRNWIAGHNVAYATYWNADRTPVTTASCPMARRPPPRRR